jgi:hypothetical protein
MDFQPCSQGGYPARDHDSSSSVRMATSSDCCGKTTLTVRVPAYGAASRSQPISAPLAEAHS